MLPALPSWSERIGVPAFFTARNHAQGVFAASGTKPSVLSLKNFSAMRNDVAYAVKLMMQEKEILLFAVLQWLVIGLAYMMWTQVLDWIPDSVWAEAARESSERSSATDWANLAIWGWSLLIIATAAYPLALLNASIVASHYLKSSGRPSTVPACLNLASKNLGRVWLFTALDAFITVGRSPTGCRARSAASARPPRKPPIMPGRSRPSALSPRSCRARRFVDSANESVWLLEDQPVRTIGIRMGYSLLCWIIGVLAYAGADRHLHDVRWPARRRELGVPLLVADGRADLRRRRDRLADPAGVRARDLEALHRRHSGQCRNRRHRRRRVRRPRSTGRRSFSPCSPASCSRST